MVVATQRRRIRLHFDANQPHQLDAVEAVADLFRGQPRGDWGASAPQELLISTERLLKNLQEVRRQHGLEVPTSLEGLEASVEMETGTGKTYVYLRTIRELNRRYGFDRFVIVVPSVAIREGLLQQSRQMAEHFGELYPEEGVETRVYRPGRDADTRAFAFDKGIQVLVLNIDAFNKRKANLIHRPTDSLGGRRPIELISGRSPIVVLDEPQNMEGPKAREAIASLSPLMVLRYSATHRRLRNLVYRLDPVRAYDLGLVKRIEVSAVTLEGGGPPPIEVKDIRPTTRGVTATLMLEAKGESGPIRKAFKVRGEGESLASLAARELYQGWEVSAVDAESNVVRFTNGATIALGAESAPEARAEVMREQLAETIREHLETELRVQKLQGPEEQMKVLSLIFVDRVSSYVDEGAFIPRAFDAAYQRLASRPRYAALNLPRAVDVRAAYFSERRGKAVDTSGRSRDDDAAYALIMKDKARLLSLQEPVRFIFSHSALREGWDNPNVFQICTLHRTRSELKKRQEIGRGLRLPVMVNGRRCHDRDLARLTLIANESYEDFARGLQAEIRDECGVEFGERVVNKRAKVCLQLRPGWRRDEGFKALWSRIGRRLRMQASPPTDVLRARLTEALRTLPELGAGAVVTRRASLTLASEGVEFEAQGGTERREIRSEPRALLPLPDPLSALQRETGLTRSTLAHVLIHSGKLASFRRDPVAFLDAASARIDQVTRRLSAEHMSYTCVSEEPLPLSNFEARQVHHRVGHLVDLSLSIYEQLSARNAEEAAWLRGLCSDPSVSMILRWPSWHRPESPLGHFDPGWVIVRGDETLCVLDAAQRQHPGRAACAAAFSEALGVKLTYQMFDK